MGGRPYCHANAVLVARWTVLSCKCFRALPLFERGNAVGFFVLDSASFAFFAVFLLGSLSGMNFRERIVSLGFGVGLVFFGGVLPRFLLYGFGGSLPFFFGFVLCLSPSFLFFPRDTDQVVMTPPHRAFLVCSVSSFCPFAVRPFSWRFSLGVILGPARLFWILLVLAGLSSLTPFEAFFGREAARVFLCFLFVVGIASALLARVTGTVGRMASGAIFAGEGGRVAPSSPIFTRMLLSLPQVFLTKALGPRWIAGRATLSHLPLLLRSGVKTRGKCCVFSARGLSVTSSRCFPVVFDFAFSRRLSGNGLGRAPRIAFLGKKYGTCSPFFFFAGPPFLGLGFWNPFSGANFCFPVLLWFVAVLWCFAYVFALCLVFSLQDMFWKTSLDVRSSLFLRVLFWNPFSGASFRFSCFLVACCF